PPPASRTRAPLAVLAMGLAFAGAAAGVALLVTHLTAGAAGVPAGRMGCAAVIPTPYGAAVGPPLPGSAATSCPAVYLPFAFRAFGDPRRRHKLARVLRPLTTAALAPSAALLLVSLVVLHRLCFLCLCLDGVNLALALLAWRLRGPDGGPVPGLFA